MPKNCHRLMDNLETLRFEPGGVLFRKGRRSWHGKVHGADAHFEKWLSHPPTGRCMDTAARRRRSATTMSCGARHRGIESVPHGGQRVVLADIGVDEFDELGASPTTSVPPAAPGLRVLPPPMRVPACSSTCACSAVEDTLPDQPVPEAYCLEIEAGRSPPLYRARSSVLGPFTWPTRKPLSVTTALND